MREMKDSGIFWIGEIPKNWEVEKLKHVLTNVSSGGTPNSSSIDYYSENGTPWVVIADMTNNDYIQTTNKKITQLAIEEKGLKIYPKGTLLYAMYASVGKVSELAIDATINQAILALEINKEKADKEYVKYFLRTWEPYIVAETNGTTQNNLNANKVMNLAMLQPSICEQQKISKYLDKKCEEIDKAICINDDSIKELKEYKQSVIYEAVTGKIEV